VVAGFNVIVFTVIAVLAHREKKQKKRNGEHNIASVADSATSSIGGGHEKKVPLVDEEEVTHVANSKI
jgi:MFS transporter, ACS family, pantothenate transporter